MENHVYGLRVTSELLENDITLERHSSAELVASLEEAIKDVRPYLKQKDLQVTLPQLNQNYSIGYNPRAVALLVEELVINAYKYSQPHNYINILAHVNNGYLSISVKNNIPPQAELSKEQEKLVTQPFYRLMPPDESIAKIEKFSLGLGLTVAENIMTKHGGLFAIRTMTDHLGDKQHKAVIAELMFPLSG
jgi:signal transduction histidine kinase